MVKQIHITNIIRPRLRRTPAVRLPHRLGQDVPVPVVRQVRLLAYGARLPVHVRIRQLHRQAVVVVRICQFGCQGAARRERRVVCDLPVLATLEAVACHDRTVQ